MARPALRNSHQTTIRFPEEMWIALEHAAARRGVSVAHYLREAARARLGEERDAPSRSLTRPELTEARRENAFERSFDQAESTAALWEQGRLARERAKLLREEARRHRQMT